nr:hypothetical protein [Polyangiaceae bacterium]
MKRAWGVQLLVSSLLVASASKAAPGALEPIEGTPQDGITFQYTAPSACPTAYEAQRIFREELVLPTKDPLRIELELREVAGRFEGDIAFQSKGEPRTRSIGAEDCKELLGAFAVIVGIAENGDRTKHKAPPANASKESLDPSTLANRDPVSSDASLATRTSIGVGAGIELGTLPSPAFLLSGHFDRRLVGRFGVGVSLFGMLPQDVTLAGRSGSATFFALGGNLRACAFYGNDRIGVIPCVGAEVSALFGTGKDIAAASSAASLNVSLLLSLRIPVRVVGAFSLSLGGDLGLGIPRPEFQIASLPVHQRS